MKNSIKLYNNGILETNNNNKLETNNEISEINNDSDLGKSENMTVDIKQLLTELEGIGSEKEKDEFIKNYSRIREQIKLVDSILDDNDIYNSNHFESKTINELFEMIELNENKIFDSDNLTIGELKYLISVCDILEKKINDDTMNIMEIK